MFSCLNKEKKFVIEVINVLESIFFSNLREKNLQTSDTNAIE